MVHKTLINKKAKSSIAKILMSAETDNYHLMSRLTTRTTPARISLVDFYWLNYWDTMVNLDRWVIIACIDIEMILANRFSSTFDFYWLLVHPQVSRHMEIRFEFFGTGNLCSTLIKLRSIAFWSKNAALISDRSERAQIQKQFLFFILIVSWVRIKISGFIIYPYRLNYQLLDLSFTLIN